MNISEDLLVRYLQGEYTSEELATVKAWESQSDDNKKILEQLYFILQASERLQKMNAEPEKENKQPEIFFFLPSKSHGYTAYCCRFIYSYFYSCRLPYIARLQ